MKKCCLVVVALFVLINTAAFSQISYGSSLLRIMGEVEPLIAAFENDYLVINRIEFDLIFEDVPKFTPVKLYPGKNYSILVYGKKGRIEDLDIKLHQKIDDEWVTVKEGENDANGILINFSPDNMAIFELEINAVKWDEDYTVGHYCLIVGYE